MPDLFAAPLPLGILLLNFLATLMNLQNVLLSLDSARVFGLEAEGKEVTPFFAGIRGIVINKTLMT